MTEQLLSAEPFNREASTLEPACGNGAIVGVLQTSGFNITAYDADRDFLSESDFYDQIITNPPYSLAFEFICKAKQIARRKFAFLLPLSYLHGKRRFDEIYSDTRFRLSNVHVFTRYPLLGQPLREDGKYDTGMMVYAWFVWDREHTGSPHLRWLDNDQYVLRKHDKNAVCPGDQSRTDGKGWVLEARAMLPPFTPFVKGSIA